MNDKKQHPSFVKSVGFAMRGLFAAAKGERNFRMQLCVFAAVVALGFLLRLTALEWVAVLVCSAMVLGAELFNTAIETVVDLVSPDFNELAGKAKDVSAAAVWVIALFAAVVGMIVFGNAVVRMPQATWQPVLWMFMTAILVVAIVLVLFALPTWLFVVGISRRKWWRVAIGVVWLVVSATLVAVVVDMFSSRHERILDHGKTPDGREYVLVQTCTGEPYAVELYIRDMHGRWVFHYVDHEIFPWRHGGRVEFVGGVARVFEGGVLFKDVELEPPSSQDAKGSLEDLPSNLSYEELFQLKCSKTHGLLQ